MPSNNSHPTLTSSPSSLSTESDVTTISSEHQEHQQKQQHQHDDSLKVLPLDVMMKNKTNLSYDKDDSTVTSSTQLPMTVNLYDDTMMKIIQKPELSSNSSGSSNNNEDGMMVQFVNNDSDNQANQPQMMPIANDEKNHHHSSDVVMEKEGRAINFPLEILSNNQNSTESSHMQINYVTTTDKTHVMSFFDLSDVSMDHDDGDYDDDSSGKKKSEYSNAKKDKKQAVSKDKIDGDKKNECSFNGTYYKVSYRFLYPFYFYLNFIVESWIVNLGLELADVTVTVFNI